MGMEKQKEEIVNIMKKYDLGILNTPLFYPDIPDQIKKNLVKNLDNEILLDNVIAVFDTTIMGKSCKDGIFFSLAGFYNSEMLEKPMYANYSDINSVKIIADSKGQTNSGNAKVCVSLKDSSVLEISNVSIKNKMSLVDLLNELIEYNSTWDSSAFEKNSGKVEKIPLPPEVKKKCNMIIHTASVACGGVGTGLAQIPLSDTAIITPIQIGMIVSLAAVFGLKITREFANSLLTGFAASIGGRAISQVLVGWIPGIGNAINTATAAGITEAIGWSVVKGFYKEEQENKAKYAVEGQKRGYVYASAEYENKLKVQAELFETQERDFRKETESYEQLLNDYEKYISELSEKTDLSEGDKNALEETKSGYEKLKNLRN